MNKKMLDAILISILDVKALNQFGIYSVTSCDGIIKLRMKPEDFFKLYPVEHQTIIKNNTAYAFKRINEAYGKGKNTVKVEFYLEAKMTWDEFKKRRDDYLDKKEQEKCIS